MTPRALVAHPGTQYSHSLARELHRAGMLSGFHTGLAIGDDSPWRGAIGITARALGADRQLENRSLRGVPAAKVHTYPMLEVGAWCRTRLGAPAKDALRLRNDAFQRAVPNRALDEANVIIGFDTSSQLLAERARTRNVPLILDRSIGHPRAQARVAGELRRRYPDWHNAADEKSEADLAIEDREHELARTIVVPSAFTASTLVESGVDRGRIRVNPFGTDVELFHPGESDPDAATLVFLFVGALSARKGLPLLLDAWKRLEPRDAELWIAGTGDLPTAAKATLPSSVRLLGAVSRSRLPALMREANVFVFPSYFEGLAQVQLEAAASALPIVATRASGGEEIIDEGKTGFLIESGSVEQLVERLDFLAVRRDVVRAMHAEARSRASHWSWRTYGDRWRSLLATEIHTA